jgi:hypothetical protein
LELIDVLSQDSGIMAEVNKYHRSSRISMHVWTKFKAFFNEHCHEIFVELRSLSCWNSQQVRRIAENRYSIKTTDLSDASMFFDLHRVLGLYFGWGLEHTLSAPIESFKGISKLAAVHGQEHDLAAWFPNTAELINSRRFQECAYHLLLAATRKDEAADTTNRILYNLALDEIFGLVPIICCCIIGLASDVLQRMEDFKQSHFFKDLPERVRDRVTQYLLFFSSNFQSISLNPRRELLANATETFSPLPRDISDHYIRNEAFAVVRGVRSTSNHDIGFGDWFNPTFAPTLPSFPAKSFGVLIRLFSPPIAEPMKWPSTLPEHMVAAIAISSCCGYVVCLDAETVEKSGKNQLQGQFQFKILCCSSGEASFVEKELAIDLANLHLSKHIALVSVASQAEPLLACAVGTKVCPHSMLKITFASSFTWFSVFRFTFMMFSDPAVV